MPVVIILASLEANQFSIISLAASRAFSLIGVAWIGVGCYINGRSCGRVHCRIDCILLPILTVIGVLGLVSIIPLDWNLFWIAFILIIAASFLPEFTWKRYS